MNTPEQPPGPPASGAAGQRLAAARIEWGVSVSEVAAYLNLSDAVIEALESGAHERLPGLTFVKGYLRAYAKLLNLDPDEIIRHAGFAPETLNEIPVTRVPLQRAGRRAREHKRRLARAIAMAAAVAAVLALGWAALRLMPGPGVERALQALDWSAGEDSARRIPLPDAGVDAGFGVGVGVGGFDADVDGVDAGVDGGGEEHDSLIIEEE